MAGKLDSKKNYGLGENVPVENIDVQGPGKFYPDDYSAQIGVYQRRSQLAASIPESFAKIITDVDDYVISASAMEAETDRQKQEELNKIDLDIQKLNMQTDVGNQVYDKYKFVQSALDLAKKKALAEGASVEAAYADILKDYRVVEEFRSPYASTLWSNTYNQLSSSALQSGRAIDTETTQYQMSNNILDAASMFRARVMNGEIDIDNAMDRFAAAVHPYTGNITAGQRDKLFRDTFQTMVQGRAAYLKIRLADDPQALMTALSALRDDYSKKDYYFLDNAGQRIKGEDGNDLAYSVGLDYNIQASLTSDLIHAGNKSAAGGDAAKKIESAAKLKEDFETATGMEGIRDTMSDETARRKSDDQLQENLRTYIKGVAQLGDAKALKDAIDDGAALNTYMFLRSLSGVNPAIAPLVLDKAISQLEKDLTSSQGANLPDYSKYVLTIASPETKKELRLASFADICEGNPNLLGVDSNNHAQAYYEKMLGTLKKYRELSRTPANLLDAMDNNYHQAGMDFASNCTTQHILKFQGGTYVPNVEGQDIISGALSKVVDMGFSKVGATVSDETMAQMFKSIEASADNVQARNMSYLYQGAAMGKAPRGGAALTSYFLRGHNNEAKVQMAMSGLLLSGQTDYLSNLSQVYAMKADNPDGYNAKLLTFTTDNSSFEKDMGDFMSKEHIPTLYSGVLSDTVKHLMMAGYSLRDAQKAVSNSFVNIDAPMTNKAKVFVHAPAYQAWDGDSELIARTMNSTIDRVAGAFPKIKKQHVPSFAVSENGATFEMYLDNQRVSSTLFGQGVGNGIYLYNPAELNCRSNPEVASFVSANAAAAQVNGFIAQSFKGSMENHMSLWGVKKGTEDEVRTKMLATAITARDINVLRNMAVDRMNGKETSLDNYKAGAIQCASDFLNDMTHSTLYVHDVFGEGENFSVGVPNVVQKVDTAKQAVAGTVKQGVSNLKGNTQAATQAVVQAYTNTPVYQKTQMDKAAGIILYQGLVKPVGRKVKNLFGAIKEKGKDYFTITGRASSIDQTDFSKVYNDAIFDAELEAKSTYAGKIDQSNISVPLSYAAQGIPEYFDAYNASTRNGYEISGAYLPGVTQEESTTGFGAGIFYMSKNNLPEGLGSDYNYSREEINSIVDNASSAFGVNANLIHAVIKQESGYQQRVVGRDKRPEDRGYGLMQLIPSTAAGLGVKDSFDAQQNIWGGTKLLADNIRVYGDTDVALAAYNGGPKAAKAWKEGHPWPQSVAYVKSVHGILGDKRFAYEYTIAHSAEKNYNKFFDADTNKLSVRKMNDFKFNLLHDPAYASGMKYIETGIDEVWSRSDLAFLREMKNKEGQPLFKKGKYNGFKVVMTRPQSNPGQNIKLASAGLGEDMARTQSSLLPQITSQQAEALASTFSGRYGQKMDLGAMFGMANLTAKEYNDYGVPLNMLENPVLQSRVLAQEFQRAEDLLGNERKAVYALAGGNLIDENGQVKSWSEIKQDKDAFTKTWFISPNKDAQEREQANELLAQYQNELRRIRGY